MPLGLNRVKDMEVHLISKVKSNRGWNISSRKERSLLSHAHMKTAKKSMIVSKDCIGT